jgi:hypothetical protein
VSRAWRAGAALAIAAGTARADLPSSADHVLPCRPTVSCTADLATPGLLELEVGYQVRRAGDDFQHGTPLLLKLPLATWIEAQVGSNGFTYIDADHHYLDNLVAGVKVHLLDQGDARPSLALTAAFSAPVAAQPGFTEADDLFLTAHASKDLGSFHVDLNAGVYVWGLDGSASAQPWTALAASCALTPAVSLTLEPHLFASAPPLAAHDAGVIAAIGVAARPWLIADGALEVTGWDQASVSAIVGLSIIPVRLW